MKNFFVGLTTVFFLLVSISNAAAFILEAIGPPGNIPIINIAIDPSNPSILYGGSVSNNYIYKSENGGLDWSQLSNGLPEISTTYMVSIDPSSPTTLYVCTTEDGVFKSTNGGASWNPINTGLTDIRIHSKLIVDPTNTSTLYVGTEGGVFKSINGGENWFFSNTGMREGEINLQAIAPSNSSILYAGLHFSEGNSEGGLFKTINGGASWFPINNGLPSSTSPESQIHSIAIDPTNNQIVYAGTAGGGVFKSTNGGESWSPLNNGLTNKFVYGITIHPSNSAVLHIGTGGGGMFSTSNSGDSWRQIWNPACLKENLVAPLAYDLSDPSILYVGAVDVETLSSGNLYKGIDEEIKPGDINNDGNISLADTILALQVISNITPPVTVFKEADINKDCQINLEDAINDLQVISGVRVAEFSSIEGSYTSGPVTVTSSNCVDPADNEAFTFPSGALTIFNQSGSNFSGTIVFQANVDGYSVKATEQLTGTINENGELSGTYEDTQTLDDEFIGSDTGTFTGQALENTLTTNFSGQDTVGDTCTHTGSATFFKSFNNESLSGNYHFSAFVANEKDVIPVTEVALGSISFDGVGTWNMTGTWSRTGLGGNLESWGDGTGTYTVNSDGTFILTTPDSTPQNVIGGMILPSADVLVSALVESDDTRAILVAVKSGTNSFSNSSLNGDYHLNMFSAEENLISPVTLTNGAGIAKINFDGAGNYTINGTLSISDAGSNLTWNEAGTYVVNADGTFTISTSESIVIRGGLISPSGDIAVFANVNSDTERNMGVVVKAGTNGFSNASLVGNYFMSQLFADEDGTPWTGASFALINFDGDGNYTINGITSRSDLGGNLTRNETGTYVVNDDGSTTITTNSSNILLAGLISPAANIAVFANVNSDTERSMGVIIKASNDIETICGNGVIDIGEQCDDAGESATCDVDCTAPICGDGILNESAGEECDDEFTYAELSGNTFQLTYIEFPTCVDEGTFINNEQYIRPDGGTNDYTIDNGCIILDPGPDTKLCVKSREGEEIIADFTTNGGDFVDRTDQWNTDFSTLNNDATALKDWFVTNGWWPGSAILADGRVTNQDASFDGKWWIDQNVLYIAHPESDTHPDNAGCVDHKAYKLVNDRLMFATDAAFTQTVTIVKI